MRYGRFGPEEDLQSVWGLVDGWVAELRDRLGYVNCKDLTSLNLKTREGLREYSAKVRDYTCADRIRFAIEKGAEMLQE